MGLKIKVNPNKDKVREIREGLKLNNNHCPCMIEQTDDTLCMCKDFREQEEAGYCHCGLYYKEFIND